MREHVLLTLALIAGFFPLVVVPEQAPASSEMLIRADNGEQAFIPEKDLEILIDGKELPDREARLSERTISEIRRHFETIQGAQTYHQSRGNIVDGCFQYHSPHMYHSAGVLRLRLGAADLPADSRFRLKELASVSETVFTGRVVSSESGYLFGSWGSILKVQVTQLFKGSLADREPARVFSRRYDLTLKGERFCNDFPDAFVADLGDEILFLGISTRIVGPELLTPQLVLRIKDGSVHHSGVKFLQMAPSMSLAVLEHTLREEQADPNPEGAVQ